MDAITLLRNDHKSVEQLFKRFEKAGERAFAEKRAIVDRIIEQLSVHAAIEEQLFYPVARATVPGVEGMTLESLEEHHIVKWVLAELDRLDPEDERFDAKVTVLIESVRHHVAEEESDLFPKVRSELGRRDLGELGNAMADAKKSAPTHPHPRSPDVPPAAAAVGAVAGVIDKVGDNLSGLAQGGVAAVQDLIARFTHSKRPASRPTGTSTARRRARSVRQTATDVVDGVESTVESAAQGLGATGRAARTGAKSTSTTARKSARTTGTAAKRATTRTRRAAADAAASTADAARSGARKARSSARSGR